MFVDTNWADVADKLVDKVSGAASQIAEKLGSAASKVWEVALLQTRLYGIEAAAGAVATLLVFVTLLTLILKYVDDAVDKVMGCIFLCSLLIPLSAFFVNFIDYTFNPAYWTAIELLNKLQGK